MLRTDEGIWYSASDVLAWLGCGHRSSLDRRALDDPALRQWLDAHRPAAALLNPDVEDAQSYDSPAQIRGDEHERAMLARLEAEGRQIVRIARPEPFTADGIRQRADETLAAMRAGAEVVFQATLLDEPWYGFADFLVRVDGVSSEFGDYAYEVRDTKLKRHASASALLQMAHYGSIVEQWQDTPPPALRVWVGTGELVDWQYADALPYLREAQSRFLLAQAANTETTADPCSACGMCRWAKRCKDEWGEHDLINVHRLSRRQRRILQSQGVDTVAQLSDAEAKPAGMASATFERLREQATVQCGTEPFVLIRPQSRQHGICAVPAPHPDDIYFDLEGDPFAGLPTLDYLWAYCDPQGRYHHRWAHNAVDERAAFRWFLDVLEAKDASPEPWHLYHYNSYEITSLKRVAEQWPDHLEGQALLARVEDLVKRRFIDLYFIVENGLRTQGGTTSLKLVEKLAGYDRTVAAAAVAKADDSIVQYERFILSRDEAERAEILQGILEYNTHDVRATHAVHVWLHGLIAQLADGDAVDEVIEEYVPSDKVRERVERTTALANELRSAAAQGPLPSGLSAKAGTMLADMLDWHRRESAVAYLDQLRLQEWARDEADPEAAAADVAGLGAQLGLDPAVQPDTRIERGTEHESVILDPVVVEVLPPHPGKRKDRYRMRCRPGSWKIKSGKKVGEVLPLGIERKPRSFTVTDFDAARGTFTIEATNSPGEALAFVLGESFQDIAIWNSLMDLAGSALEHEPASEHLLGLAVLDREVPLASGAMHKRDGEDAGKRARRILKAMDAGLLPVQGPPGTGKTWLAARLIEDALAADPKATIYVTANSHRVIDNLMEGANEHLDAIGVGCTFVRVAGEGRQHGDYVDEVLATSPALCEYLGQGGTGPRVIGATRFALAQAQVAGTGALLLIDEAGQFTLADSLSVLHVASVAVALGDPQQLSAPVQAAHDPAVQVSLLEHITAGSPVMPDERGVFLDVSYRMHPAVCEVVGRLAYNGELHAAEEAAARDITSLAASLWSDEDPEGPAIAPGVRWMPVPGGVEAQVQAVCDTVRELLDTAIVRESDGSEGPLTAEEILVVAPHNATVNQLRHVLPDEVRVGTVDRFQGQEGHVVVLAMGRTAEEPGDVPFLYQLNRVNVALSRARLMSIVIADPRAMFPPVSEPEHLRLASRFITAMGGGELTQERSEEWIRAAACPACGAKAVLRPIAYGLPGGDFDFDRYAVGGCVVYGGMPDVDCSACGWRGQVREVLAS